MLGVVGLIQSNTEAKVVLHITPLVLFPRSNPSLPSISLSIKITSIDSFEQVQHDIELAWRNLRDEGPGSELCISCQRLRLDDPKHGGMAITSPQTGAEILDFPHHKSSSNKLIDDDGFFLLDDMPDLPRLQASAENGCACCGFLRRAIQRLCNDLASRSSSAPQAGPIDIHIVYDFLRAIGLDGDSTTLTLTGEIKSCSSGQVWLLPFTIGSIDGKIPPQRASLLQQ